MQTCKLSLVIPSKDKNDPKLKELLASIDRQNFPKEEMETLIITEGTSESAKAIGIKRAKGEVIGILASDNELVDTDFLSMLCLKARKFKMATYPMRYHYESTDNILNRYFSLFGFNDPLAFYMDKNDRQPFFDEAYKYWNTARNRTIGDNGFFVPREFILQTDLDHYYHIDNAVSLKCNIEPHSLCRIWHKTSGNIFKFFAKRYRYGLQHAFNKNRRWHLVDFRQPKDIWRLIWFILCGLTLVQPLYLSFHGWLKIRAVAWFLHPVITLITILNYSVLMIHIGLRKLLALLFVPMTAQKA